MRRWEGNIRVGLRKIKFEDVEWIHQVYDTISGGVLVNTVVNPRVL